MRHLSIVVMVFLFIGCDDAQEGYNLKVDRTPDSVLDIRHIKYLGDADSSNIKMIGRLMFNRKTGSIDHISNSFSIDDSDAQKYLIQYVVAVDAYNWMRLNRDYSPYKCIQLVNKWIMNR